MLLGDIFGIDTLLRNKDELFRHVEQAIHELTLKNRIWGLLLELVQVIIGLLELEIDDMDEFMTY